MEKIGILLTFLCTVSFSCYHATIETGLEPSGKVVEHAWALGFVFGLVPPPTVNAAADCKNGVAKVETQLSFLNQLVSSLSGGIITPMHITVTCAQASSFVPQDVQEDLLIAHGSSEKEVVASFEQAAQLAVQKEEPVYVRFE